MLRPKFLLDADMPRSSVAAIRSLGFDVQDVRDLGMRYAKKVDIFLVGNAKIEIMNNPTPGSLFIKSACYSAIIFGKSEFHVCN